MKKLLQTLFIILPLILLSTACDDETTASTDCIDESLIDPDIICITLWDPVCGCDDVTYSNDCVATGAGVTSWTQGSCP